MLNTSSLHFLPSKVEKVFSEVVVLLLTSHVRFIMLEVRRIMTGLGVLSLTVLFHQKGHPGLGLKSNSSSNIIYPFVCSFMFQFFFSRCDGGRGLCRGERE